MRRATTRYLTARAERDEAIRAAVADGKTQRAVADAAGVSHTRVQQILRDR